MKKLFTLLSIILTGIIIASLYGIIHDQITFSISPEYYTKFKFYQFGLMQSPEDLIKNPRQMAIVVGIMATWWMGLIIGLIFSFIVFSIKPYKLAIITALKAMIFTVFITFLTELLGLAYGYIFLAGHSKENFEQWCIPDTITDLNSFIIVGSMHNFSYLGGLIGLIVGIIYLVKFKRKHVLSLSYTDNNY
ncbi:hypothetical protein [Flavobacterium rivuli]|uniref:hypothetical protein n=1 Tax=Flavobacterium rivuli TaxID=498301 RepID=UPI0003773C96|nr:hypothetical protein [Flavobacterium rivuli]